MAPFQLLRFHRVLTEAALRLAAGATVEDLFASVAPALCASLGLNRMSLSAGPSFRRDFSIEANAAATPPESYPIALNGRHLGTLEIAAGSSPLATSMKALMQDVCLLFATALSRAEASTSGAQREEWRALFDEHPAPLAVYTVDRAEILAVNAAFCESYGYEPSELVGRRFTEVCVPDAEYAELLVHNDAVNPAVRCRHHKRDGTRLDVEVSTRYCLWEGESACVALINDVTSRTRVERRLVESEKRLERVQEIGGVGIFEVDFGSGRRYWSSELRRQMGIGEHDELSTHKAFDFDVVHEEDREAVRAAFDLAIAERVPLRVDHRVVRPSGDIIWLQLQADVACSADGTPLRIIGTTVDITNRKNAEQQLGFLAHYDPLTGLANRANAMSRLRTLLQSHGKRSRPTVLFVDTDHFKEINDTLGHEAGDQVLIEIGKRLQQTLRDTDCVARIGGDEFIVILANRAIADQAPRVARRINEAVEKPMRIAGRDIVLTCSIGVAQTPVEGIDVEGLVGRADMAMYQAKRTGRNRFAIYEDGMLRETLERFQMESELRLAIERQEFFLAYQPIVSIGKRELSGAEALVRWRHPDGDRTPEQFIAIAEDSDLIVTLGDWVLREACRQGSLWARERPGFYMSVNVSRRQLSNPNYPDHVLSILEEAGFDPKLLQLELTETTLTRDLERAHASLFKLRQAGVRIAIDDFGTGYNSLSNLRHTSVIDALKIDRSFISGVCTQPSDMAIAGAVVTAGRNLGIRVIAEGVESEDHMETLRRLGCDDAQGYWFSEPIEAACFEAKFIRPDTSTSLTA